MPLLTCLLVLLSMAMPAGQARKTGDLFDEIFARGTVKQKTLKSIRAQFTETTVSTLLVKPIVARGTIVAAPPARVRMSYTEPDTKIITMDGRTLTVEWPARKEQERIDIRETQKRIDQYFTSASIDDLRKMFDIKAAPDTANRNTDRVEMTPKRKQIKQGLSMLELWINRETDLLMQMRLTFAGGDQKTVVLEDIAVNVPVSDDTFRTRP